MFIPQLVAALLFLGFAYVTGKVHAHLLVTGARTQGEIIALVPVRMQDRSRSGTTTIYEPVIEFGAVIACSISRVERLAIERGSGMGGTVV